jgi:membrane associated rhomboid family serine protease
MLPIGDDNSARRIVPVVTYALIAINVLVFLLELTSVRLSRRAFVPSFWPIPPGLPHHLHPCSCTVVAPAE